jgi:hypothetical protein
VSEFEKACLDSLRRIEVRVGNVERTVLPLITRAVSRKEQARKAGVHPSTIWRREKRQRARLRAEGAI